METKKEELIEFDKMLMGEPILVSKNYPMKRILNVRNIEIEYNEVPKDKVKTTQYDEEGEPEGFDIRDLSLGDIMAITGTRLSNSILKMARVQLQTAQLIAEAILKSSNNIAYSIRQVADEMERKNKLDEYYMLLDKIEQYEDMLVEKGVIKEAYENIEIIKYPTIDMDEKCQWMLLRLEEEDRAAILAKAKQTCTNPIVILEEILSSTPNSWFINEDSRIIEISTGMRKRVKIPWHRYYNVGARVSLREGDLVGNEINIGHCKKCYEENGKYIFSLELIEAENIGKRVIESVYTSITDEAISKMKLHSSYAALMSELDSINRDIQIANLRFLYLQLRSAVRKYKISKSNG